MYTFLEEDYDNAVNGNDRVHGKPLWIKENPAVIDSEGVHIDESNIRYTMGVYDVTIGSKTFETIKVMLPQSGVVTESFIDRKGRLVLMRWYESSASIESNENYSKDFVARIRNNPSLTVNEIPYVLIEDRISAYAL